MRARVVGVALGVVASFVACSLITDLSTLGSADATTDALPDVALPDACSGPTYACAVSAPSGWTGPFALYDGNPNNVPTSCPALAAVNVVNGYVGVDGGAATCGACTGCTLGATGTLMGYSDFACTMPNCDGGALSSGQCASPPGLCPGSMHYKIKNPALVCNTPAPPPTIPPFVKSEQGYACATQQFAQINCAAGQVCVPSPSPPFNPQLCVGMAGDVVCPGAPYSVKHVFETQISDTRGCSGCPCTMTDAGVTIEGWSGSKCTGSLIGLSAQCFDTFLGDSVELGTTGSCAVSGAPSPTGTVTTSNPFTVCCQP